MRNEQDDYTDEDDELEEDFEEGEEGHGPDDPREEGGGVLTIDDARREWRLQQMEVEHAPKPETFAGCELCHWTGKIRSERGCRVCHCALRQRVWKFLGALGQAGQQLDPAELKASTALGPWSSKSRVIVGSWPAAMPHVVRALAIENMARLTYHHDTAGGITGARLCSINLTTDADVLAWELDDAPEVPFPASLDFEVVVLRLGFAATSGYVLEAIARRAAAGKTTWVCSEAPYATWPKRMQQTVEGWGQVEVPGPPLDRRQFQNARDKVIMTAHALPDAPTAEELAAVRRDWLGYKLAVFERFRGPMAECSPWAYVREDLLGHPAWARYRRLKERAVLATPEGKASKKRRNKNHWTRNKDKVLAQQKARLADPEVRAERNRKRREAYLAKKADQEAQAEVDAVLDTL